MVGRKRLIKWKARRHKARKAGLSAMEIELESGLKKAPAVRQRNSVAVSTLPTGSPSDSKPSTTDYVRLP